MIKQRHETKKDITNENLVEGREYLVHDTAEKDGVHTELDKWTLTVVDGEWCLNEDLGWDLDGLVDSVVFIPVCCK